LGAHAIHDRERFKNAGRGVFLEKSGRVNLHGNGRRVFRHLFHGSRNNNGAQRIFSGFEEDDFFFGGRFEASRPGLVAQQPNGNGRRRRHLKSPQRVGVHAALPLQRHRSGCQRFAGESIEDAGADRGVRLGRYMGMGNT
jgi:hypothetical protein